MQIRIGYQLSYESPQPTPMILTLNVRSRRDHGPGRDRTIGGVALTRASGRVPHEYAFRLWL